VKNLLTRTSQVLTRIFLTLGGIAGVYAIIAIVQTIMGAASEGNTQATVIANMETQIVLQKTIAANSDPIRVAMLQNTANALVLEQQRLDVTKTPGAAAAIPTFAPVTPQIPTSTSTEIPTPAATATPSDTPVPTNTRTPQPTATNTPEPTPRPTISSFRDDFDGALSDNWEQRTSGLATSGGKLIGTGSMLYEPEIQNNYVKTRIKINDGGGDFPATIVVASSQNHGLGFSCGSQGCVWQEINHSLSAHNITPLLRFDFNQNEYYDIRIDVKGGSCTVFINEENFSSIRRPTSDERNRVGLKGTNSGIDADFFEVIPIQ
jgi:hypothetical protein